MTVVTHNDLIYTRDEQITALKQLIHDHEWAAQRRLARVIWYIANRNIEIARLEMTLSESDIRNARMLVHVPLATIYNRIRRITGKIN